jgi:hypothetical protein
MMAKLADDDAAGKNDAGVRLRKDVRRVLETLRPDGASLPSPFESDAANRRGRPQAKPHRLVKAVEDANARHKNTREPKKPENPENLRTYEPSISGQAEERLVEERGRLVEVGRAAVDECAAHEKPAWQLSFYLASALKVRGIPPDPELIAPAIHAAVEYLEDVPLQLQDECIPDTETLLSNVLRKYDLVRDAGTVLDRAIKYARMWPGQLEPPVRTGPLSQRVAAVCYHLQLEVGREPFYLSQRMLADRLGCSQPAISTALLRLRHYDVIRLASEDVVPGRRAKTYRFNFTSPLYTAPKVAE